MKKIIIIGITILAATSTFIACGNVTEKSDRVVQVEDQMKYETLDKKLGLEDIGDENFDNLFEVAMFNEDYKKKRASKIKKEAITEETIKEVVSRAKYLVDKYFTDPNIKEINYIYMEVINAVDSLGPHLNKDLALNLLKKCAQFGTVEELDEKIKNKDDSLYWYNYVTQLLYQYYRTTDEVSSEDKRIILEYLAKCKNYLSSKVDSIDTIAENATTDYIEQTAKIQKFLSQ